MAKKSKSPQKNLASVLLTPRTVGEKAKSAANALAEPQGAITAQNAAAMTKAGVANVVADGEAEATLTRREAIDALPTLQEVTGLEPDPDMAAAARARGVRVIQQDAHDPFGPHDFDAVFSNAALHWMRDPPRVLANARRALRPGGRLVAEQGGWGNVAAIVTALNAAREALGLTAVQPWDFPSPSLQRRRLGAAGFAVEAMALLPRPTPLPTGMAGWLATFAGPFLRDVSPQARGPLLLDAERRLGALRDPVEGWAADYVRLRFVAHATQEAAPG